MKAEVKAQVEMAIREKLHVGKCRADDASVFWLHPISVTDNSITMLKSDCGDPRNQWDIRVWSEKDWCDHVDAENNGLFKKVGFWNFESYNDPAADAIAHCHRNPSSAGRELYQLRQYKAKMEAKDANLKTQTP